MKEKNLSDMDSLLSKLMPILRELDYKYSRMQFLDHMMHLLLILFFTLNFTLTVLFI